MPLELSRPRRIGYSGRRPCEGPACTRSTMLRRRVTSSRWSTFSLDLQHGEPDAAHCACDGFVSVRVQPIGRHQGKQHLECVAEVAAGGVAPLMPASFASAAVLFARVYANIAPPLATGATVYAAPSLIGHAKALEQGWNRHLCHRAKLRIAACLSTSCASAVCCGDATPRAHERSGRLGVACPVGRTAPTLGPRKPKPSPVSMMRLSPSGSRAAQPTGRSQQHMYIVILVLLGWAAHALWDEVSCRHMTTSAKTAAGRLRSAYPLPPIRRA